jgi:uncharacterized membrane protein
MLQMDQFTRTHYLEYDQGGEDGYAYTLPYTSMYSTDMMMPPAATYPVVTDELVPTGQVAVHRGMEVEAVDGPVGQVGEILLDPETGQITHFTLMKGHGWGQKEVAIQTSTIEKIEGEVIYLKIEKSMIEQLPSLPVKRNWNEVYATELELMVWVYDQKDLAKQALEKIQELRKQYAMDILNATVLEKEQNGNIRVHEQKKVKSKGRVALGIALGGLAGLLIGPVALVAGAIAGGAAARRSAKKIEVGFSEEKLKKLNECLALGGSALVLVVEHRWFNTLQVGLAENGGQLIYERLANVTFDNLKDQVQKA